MNNSTNTPLLEVKDLKVHFPIRKGFLKKTVAHVRAVDGISFNLMPGETLGLVGESGCGKTTVAKALVRLVGASGGSVKLLGKNLLQAKGKDLQKLRKEIQMIFQDPFSSLDPKMTVGEIIGEAVEHHRKGDCHALVMQYMELCGLRSDYFSRYPHEFSGGQRQRVGIARALATEPSLVIADEPVSALDVSVQAKALNLMKKIQKDLEVAYLFITHDLSVVKHISDHIAVMYLGNIVEIFPSAKLKNSTKHPYTRALISSIPSSLPGQSKEQIELQGEIPSPIMAPSGCKFHTRCPHVTEVCTKEQPQLSEIAPKHQVACHHWQKLYQKRQDKMEGSS